MSGKADNKDQTPVVTVSDDIAAPALRKKRQLISGITAAVLVVAIILGLAIHGGVFESAKVKQYKKEQAVAVKQQSVNSALSPTAMSDYTTAESNLKQLAKQDPKLLDDLDYNVQLFEICAYNLDKPCMHTSAKQIVALSNGDTSYQKKLVPKTIAEIKEYSK